MNKILKYFLVFIIAALVLLLALSIDNIMWISKSPEWATSFTVSNGPFTWTGPVYNYNIFNFIGYVAAYRIASVWSNWRDINSALITGAIVTGAFILFDLARHIHRHIKKRWLKKR